jgi:hypothetical protein
VRLARAVIEYSEAVGDCELGDHELKASTVRFGDYAGAAAFQSRVMGLPEPTVRDFISMQAIVMKIDRAAVVAARRAA